MILEGSNKDILTQIKLLEDILMSSDMIKKALIRAQKLSIENYYIGAGCITQTVWNYLSNKPLDYGIKDIDFIYYDKDNLHYESEHKVIQSVKELFYDIELEIDVKNQARVHLWYEERFGYSINPYTSCEDAINTWPTTATAIGVKLVQNELKVYAPFGLNDLFAKIIRPNKAQITEIIYNNKVSSWLQKWSDLAVIPW